MLHQHLADGTGDRDASVGIHVDLAHPAPDCVLDLLNRNSLRVRHLPAVTVHYVLADGAWGFAATEDLTRAGVQIAAGQAVEIARASAQVKQHDVRLAPEKAYTDDWSSPYQIDPFGISVEQNLDLLMRVDAELRAVKGITLAETNMNFRRYEQWYYSSDGSDIHQVKHTTGAGYAAFSFAGSEIQKRSYPTSFGGQWQDKGYELIHEQVSLGAP